MYAYGKAYVFMGSVSLLEELFSWDVCVYWKCKFMGRIMFMGRICLLEV